MSQQITLYDIPSKEPCESWSANVLKTRMALNFKGIHYKTEWLPYYLIETTLKAKGIPANPEGSFAAYSLPAVQFADGSYCMDSAQIAPKLEELQPTPSLNLNAELEEEVTKTYFAAFMPLCPYFMPRLNRDILITEDYGWHYADRSKRLGCDLFELEKQKGGAVALESARPGLDALAKLLKDHKKDEGPFLLGSQVCYADFIIAAALHMFKQLGDEAFKDIVGEREEFIALYQASGAWLKKLD